MLSRASPASLPISLVRRISSYGYGRVEELEDAVKARANELAAARTRLAETESLLKTAVADLKTSRSDRAKRNSRLKEEAEESSPPIVALKDMRANIMDLPRLPVPDLGDTLSRYSSSVQPLFPDSKAFTLHLNKLSSFASTIGPSLQSNLRFREAGRISKGKYPHSYVEGHWDEMYLGGRWSLPVNSNPFYLLRGVEDEGDSMDKTGAMLSGMMRWHKKIVGDKLEADHPHQNCM